jgi:hypothetical protein
MYCSQAEGDAVEGVVYNSVLTLFGLVLTIPISEDSITRYGMEKQISIVEKGVKAKALITV